MAPPAPSTRAPRAGRIARGGAAAAAAVVRERAGAADPPMGGSDAAAAAAARALHDAEIGGWEGVLAAMSESSGGGLVGGLFSELLGSWDVLLFLVVLAFGMTMVMTEWKDVTPPEAVGDRAARSEGGPIRKVL